VQEALQAAGVYPKKYSGHSFRIGAATTAVARGMEDSGHHHIGKVEKSGLPGLHGERNGGLSHHHIGKVEKSGLPGLREDPMGPPGKLL
jgi:hypothetical protein